MPPVLLGNIAFGKNDPKLVKWIWTGRNYKHLMEVRLAFPRWSDFSNWAVSPGGGLWRPCLWSCHEDMWLLYGMRLLKSGQVPHMPSIDLISVQQRCADCQSRVAVGVGRLASWASSPASFCAHGWPRGIWWESDGYLEPKTTPLSHGCWCRLSKLLFSVSLVLRFNVCGIVWGNFEHFWFLVYVSIKVHSAAVEYRSWADPSCTQGWKSDHTVSPGAGATGLPPVTGKSYRPQVWGLLPLLPLKEQNE